MPGERFHVRLLPEEGGGPGERVVAEVGMEGFNILDASGARALRKYPLHHISRWSSRGGSLILFTRSPVDVEDRSVGLAGDETTIRSVLDTLTCSCMQMAEMLQSGQGPSDGGGQVAANSLNALLRKAKKPALLTADQVEFWRQPEKAGWMHSQGEHIRTWRKRWFVLKQGFLFRFGDQAVTAASKPRGIVDLSTVTDVSDGGATTGRPHSVKLSTATGHICYLCESETAQVEWYSALEGAVARIVKLVAGVEDEEPPARGHGHGGSHGHGGGGGHDRGGKGASWAEQLERTYNAVGSTSGARRSGTGGGGGSGGGPQMVSIVNYDSAPGGGGGGGSGRLGGGGSAEAGYVTVDYGSIAGANSVPDSAPGPAAGGYSAGGYGAPAGGYGGGGGAYGMAPAQAQQAAPQQQQQAYGYPQQAPDYGAAQAAPQAAGYGGGGNLMDAVTAPQAAQQAQSGSPWQVHYTAEGRPYFYNAQTGVTQWNAPA